MPIRATHTYAILEVSRPSYDEIRAKFVEAGYPYPDQIHPDSEGERIDMHGIAVRAEPMPELPDHIEVTTLARPGADAPSPGCVAVYDGAGAFCFYADADDLRALLARGLEMLGKTKKEG